MKECGYSLIDIWESFIQGSEYDLYYLNSKKNSTLRVPKSVIKYIKIDRQSGLSRFLLTDSEGSIVQ